MLDVMTIFVFAVVFLLCYLFLRKQSNLPPGPPGWPIIGNLMFFRQLAKRKLRTHEALIEEHEKYGDVIYMHVGNQGMLFLHGVDAIQEAFVNHSDVFSNRPHWLKYLKEPTKEGKGVIWQSGHEWKVMRKFVLQTLRDFGVGKTSLEEKIMFEIDAATECLAETHHKPTDVRDLTQMMIANIIYGIIFDKRFEYNDEEYHKILHTLDTLFVQGAGIGFPAPPSFIMKIIDRKGYAIMKSKLEAIRWLKAHICKEIEDHETSFDSSNIRDFVDLYLQAKEEESEKSLYTPGNMFRTIMDLFFAGAETTSNTVNWCVLFMQEYPDVQEKCQRAIGEVCGERAVTWSDRESMPYIEAVLLEIQRFANIAPSSVPHCNEVDATLMGYNIPKRTLVTANLYSAHMDPKYWTDPQKFNPDRFLENGKIKKNPAFMPFSLGPRVCLGEPLAKMEMFLMFTNLLQRFTFAREDPNTRHSLKAKPDQFTSAPLPYKTVAISRL